MTNKKEYYKRYHLEWKKNSKKVARKRALDILNHRRKRKNNPGLKGRESRAYRAKNPQKVRAHRILNYAVIMGHIKKSACEMCGAKRVHGHHDDYSRPLDVRWLCSIHHVAAHQKLKQHARKN